VDIVFRFGQSSGQIILEPRDSIDRAKLTLCRLYGMSDVNVKLGTNDEMVIEFQTKERVNGNGPSKPEQDSLSEGSSVSGP
jgi:hypothetical protein